MGSRIHKGKGFTEIYLSRLCVLIIVFFAGCNNTAENYDCFQSRSNTYVVEELKGIDTSFLLVQSDDFVHDSIFYDCYCVTNEHGDKAYISMSSFSGQNNYRKFSVRILISRERSFINLTRNSDLPFKSDYYIDAVLILNRGIPFKKDSILMGKFNSQMVCVDSLRTKPAYVFKTTAQFKCQLIETSNEILDDVLNQY